MRSRTQVEVGETMAERQKGVWKSLSYWHAHDPPVGRAALSSQPVKEGAALQRETSLEFLLDTLLFVLIGNLVFHYWLLFLSFSNFIYLLFVWVF